MPDKQSNKQKRRTTKPAEGERRALGGYIPQYLVAAYLILRSLRNGSLQWIRVADPEAGRVDDIQIGSQSRVDAFQVKWSQYQGNFTFNRLVSASGDEPSLIRQLADGWQQLRNSNSGARIVVHLVTNDIPSTSDQLPVDENQSPSPRHFAAFLGQVWQPARKNLQNPNWSLPAGWKPTWDKIQAQTNLPDDDFLAFIQDCELEFNYNLPVFETGTTQEENGVGEDVEHIFNILFKTVTDPERRVQLSRDDLLARLGWKNRLDFKSRHEFPVDELFYSPIEETVAQLEQAISNLPGGYIAILGTPGSGKSTLLTQTLRYRQQERIIKYYAYIPDAQDPTTLRGEAINFLHDVGLALDCAGFRVGENPSKLEREQLLQRFHQQLRLLHEDWQNHGRKTIILIDGLDHIAREHNPTRSLLRDLPLPEQVPEGVYFLLGSQTEQLADLPARLQHAIKQEERRIEMQPLKRQAVMQIIERIGLASKLSVEQKEQVYQLSGGHPLALIYLLQRLQEATDADTITTILQETVPYTGRIEEDYYSYWRQIEETNNDELEHFLGLIARLRGVIDLDWIQKTGTNRNVIKRFREKLFHYFKREDDYRWYFFHNSFRLFLLEKTATLPPDSFDSEIDKEFYHELAEKCASSPENSYWLWEELYYRVKAEEHQLVLENSSQEWFRRQFLAFRPIDAIEADIKFALKSVNALKNPVALTRLLLAGAELSQKAFHLKHTLEGTAFAPFLLQLEDYQMALEHIRSGNRLQMGNTAALEMSLVLKSEGLIEEGQRVFDLAEPLDILSGSSIIENDVQSEQVKLLETWAEVAVNFRNLEQIIKTIRNVRKTADSYSQLDDKTVTYRLQNRMLFHMGLVLIEQQRWEEIAIIKDLFQLDKADELNFWFWLQVHSWKRCQFIDDLTRASQFLRETLEKISQLQTTHPESLQASLNYEADVALAEAIFRLFKDEQQTREWIKNIPQPELQSNNITLMSKDSLDSFYQRFRLNRLLYALGMQQAAAEIIPSASESQHQGMVYFERAICVVAEIWGLAWRGEKLDSLTVTRKVFSLLHLFNKTLQETRHWYNWYILERNRGEFYELLIEAVAQHGQEAVESLRVEFEKQWDNLETNSFWSTAVRRQVILALWQAGVSQNWAVQKLRLLEEGMLEGHDVSGRIQECRKQAEAWIALNDKQSAHRLLKQLLHVSFGVDYRKDYQFDTWIEWLGRINEIEPEKAAERISWFAQATIKLQEITEGKAAKYAANTLLAVAFRWSPRRAVSLFYWFAKQQIIWYDDAIYTLIREALRSKQPPLDLILVIVADFLLPIMTEANSEVAMLLIQKIAENQSPEKALEAAQYLIDKINIYALPSTRSTWRYAVASELKRWGFELQDINLELADIKSPQGELSSNFLKLKDGSVLSKYEVGLRVTSISHLQELLECESDDSYFNWASAITSLVREAGKNDIYNIARIFSQKRSYIYIRILVILSQRLRVIGDNLGAWKLGEEILNSSSTISGWFRLMGEGDRLDAFNNLASLDANRTRTLAYQRLIQDLTSESWYPQNVVHSLDEIFSLLTDDLPLPTIWVEIEDYVKNLFPGFDLSKNEPTDIHLSPSEDTPLGAIADLVLSHLEHPASTVKQAAQRALFHLLLKQSNELQNIIKEYFNRNDNHRENLLRVLESVSYFELKAVIPFREQLEQLFKSPNWIIRQIAKKIGQSLGCELLINESYYSGLPEIYQISLPTKDLRRTFNGETISAEGLLFTSDDPIEILRAFKGLIQLIADDAELPAANIRYRVVQFMQQLVFQDLWSESGEKQLSESLDSLGLRFPFWKPRVVVARQAICCLITELAEAGRLSLNSLNQLEKILQFYDPIMLVTDPTLRSVDISGIEGKFTYSQEQIEWLSKTNDVFNLVKIKTTDQRIILAEETKLKRLESEKPTEIRCSVIRTQKTASTPENHSESIFLVVNNHQVSEYPNLQVNPSPTNLIICHKALYYYDSPGVNWLALNPSVGRTLGWTPSTDGLFKWVDSQGRVMVESVWWIDGIFNQYNLSNTDEVGEGWLVLASQEAWGQIVSYCQFLKQIVFVSRQCGEQQKSALREITLEPVNLE
jgi:hypothetical protein